MFFELKIKEIYQTNSTSLVIFGIATILIFFFFFLEFFLNVATKTHWKMTYPMKIAI